MSTFSGSWFSTFGPLVLNEDGGHVHGHYSYSGRDCSLEGEIEDGRLVFTYHEPDHDGEGWFELKRDGKFVGAWRTALSPRWSTWEGTRGFDGVWDATFGRLRLIQEEDRVFGFYEGAGSSTVEGRLEGNRLTFRYQEPKAAEKASSSNCPRTASSSRAPGGRMATRTGRLWRRPGIARSRT
ncbi:MAG: hypothetical protein U0793_30465 [Gemmataceae bacterium]